MARMLVSRSVRDTINQSRKRLGLRKLEFIEVGPDHFQCVDLELNRIEGCDADLAVRSDEELWPLFDAVVPSGPPNPQYSTKAENEAWLKARFG